MLFEMPSQKSGVGMKIDSGDTAWMIRLSALVLLMTVPGLALFYGGMVRKKNVLATAGAKLWRHLRRHRAVDGHRLFGAFTTNANSQATIHRRLLYLMLGPMGVNSVSSLAPNDP